jgi:hypothetical protein
MIRHLSFCFFLAFLVSGVIAQPPSKSVGGYGPSNVVQSGGTNVIDGVYVKTAVPQKKPIGYEHVREADVIWSKRVWSYIDLREKMNHPLFYPFDTYEYSPDEVTYPDGIHIVNNQRYSLWNIIKLNVMEARFTPYYVSNPNIFPIPSADNWDLSDLKNDGYDFKYPLFPKISGGNYWTDKEYRDILSSDLFGTYREEYLPKKDEDDNPIMTTIQEVDEAGKPIFGEDGLPIFKQDVDTIPQKTIYKSQDIVRYHLKTDWFFDKERSVLDHRIIAIAPVIFAECNPEKQEETGTGATDEGTEANSGSELTGEPDVDFKKAKDVFDKYKLDFGKKPTEQQDSIAYLTAEIEFLTRQSDYFDYVGKKTDKKNADKLLEAKQKRKADLEAAKPAEEDQSVPGSSSDGKIYCYKELFWLYFPQMRPYLQTYYTYNDKNDAQWMSFDDLFWKTKYTQVIYKESNVYDRKIESYRRGVDALIESERIKEEIRTFEHDVWNF